LRNVQSPIGVAEYQLVASLPKELKTELPSIEEIEARLSAGIVVPTGRKSAGQKVGAFAKGEKDA